MKLIDIREGVKHWWCDVRDNWDVLRDALDTFWCECFSLLEFIRRARDQRLNPQPPFLAGQFFAREALRIMKSKSVFDKPASEDDRFHLGA